jgi:hypothetical protein
MKAILSMAIVLLACAAGLLVSATTFELYEGDHTNRIAARLETKVLPFFSKQLDFATKH